MSIELNIIDAEGTRRRLVLGGSSFQIGRNPTCEVSFENAGNESVSWEHAVVTLSEPPTLVDQGSSNGTFLDGERVEGVCELSAGNVIGLGLLGPKIEVVAIAASPGELNVTTPTPSSLFAANRNAFLVLGALVGVAVLAVVAISSRDRSSTSENSTEATDATVGTPLIVESEQESRVELPTIVRQSNVDQSNAPAPNPLPTRPELAARLELTAEQIRAKYASTAVWAGMRIQDSGSKVDSPARSIVMPWCTGWVDRDGSAIVTAERALDLRKASEQESIEPVICQPSVSDELLTPTQISTHPNFNVESPMSGNSPLHDAGTLLAKELVMTSHRRAEVASLIDERVFVCGFQNILDGQPAPLTRLSSPQFNIRQATITRTRVCTDCSDLIPLLEIQFADSPNDERPASEKSNPPRFDGMLVCDRFGDLIGHVVTLSDGLFVLSIENIQP